VKLGACFLMDFMLLFICCLMRPYFVIVTGRITNSIKLFIEKYEEKKHD